MLDQHVHCVEKPRKIKILTDTVAYSGVISAMFSQRWSPRDNLD